MIIKFYYNKEKDLENYDSSYFKGGKDYPDYGYDREKWKKDIVANLPSTIINGISSESEDKNRKNLIKYLGKFSKDKQDFINLSKTSLEALWKPREANYIARLEEVFKKDFPFKEINVYFTTLGVCPYNIGGGYFYVSFWYDLGHQISTICHEVMHFMFRSNYEQYCADQGLNKSQMMDLNESLTVMLNFKFFDLLIKPSRDYKPSTVELKKKIVEWCREDKDFPYILDESIKFLKT